LIGKLFKRFVSVAYVGVVKDGDVCDVCLRVLKNKKETHTDNKRFNLDSRESARLLDEYIEQVQKKYNIIYTSTVLNSINQGGVPGCDRSSFSRYEIDVTNAATVCVDKRWSVFASSYDIESAQREYDSIGGLDFIFSSLVLMKRFWDKHLSETPSLCLLKMKTSVTIGIFTQDRLLYSNYSILMTEKKVEGDEEEKKKAEDIFSGEESEFGEESLVDLDEIALELDDPTVAKSDFQQLPTDGKGASLNMENLGNDLKILEFVKTSLNNFYKNPMYESSFIGQILLADPYGASNETKGLLESELMLSVFVKKIELCGMVNELAIEEGAF
jgi:hypothetical protein